MSLAAISSEVSRLSEFNYSEEHGKFLVQYVDIDKKFKRYQTEAESNDVILTTKLVVLSERHYKLAKLIKKDYINQGDYCPAILHAYKQNMIQYVTDILLQIEEKRPRTEKEMYDRLDQLSRKELIHFSNIC